MLISIKGGAILDGAGCASSRDRIGADLSRHDQDFLLKALHLTGLTRKGERRRVLLETTLFKCKSQRALVGLLLSDLILLLEQRGSKFYLYRAVPPSLFSTKLLLSLCH